MADVDKFSTRLIDFAERFADMTDAAQGRGSRQGGIRARWILLPAAGAGLYALGASGSLVRQAKNVAKEAKNRAVELPDDLMSRVHQATRSSSGARNGSQSATSRTSRPRTSSRRRTGSRRRTTQASSTR